MRLRLRRGIGVVLLLVPILNVGCTPTQMQRQRPMTQPTHRASNRMVQPAPRMMAQRPMHRPAPAPPQRQPMVARQQVVPPSPEPILPTEKQKVTHPEYQLEVPDILLIDVIRAIPKGPYKIQPLDALVVNVPQALRDEPIAGVYPVGPEGRINLGLNYGAVSVVDMTVEEAEEAIRKHMSMLVTKPKVTVSLAGVGAVQQIRNEHIINPDGTVRLGKYGSVYVAGMTLDQAKEAIEEHLSQFLVKPEVSISVFAYNSKFYYVITDGAGYGEQVYRFPSTGNETVLDAMSMIFGLPAQASKRHIWVARPAPPNCGMPDQILPVDWCAITRGARTKTNFQLLPGDRVYVMAQPIMSASLVLAKILEPFERLFGVTLLGGTTVQTLSGQNVFNGP